jgi:hypothetical protein
MNLRHLLMTLCFFPLYLSAACIPGNYEVSGFDPTLNEEYTGTAVITETSPAVYTIVWTYVGFDPIIGTGVIRDDFVSFVYSQGETFGTQLYEIKGKKLKGPWILFGDTRIGCEQLRRVSL